ncbi:MAG: hypothetical protein ACXWCY_15490 [Burkholderiales bacterium]
MRDLTVRCTALMGAATMVAILAWSGNASAQGKIVCWKDSTGKVIGCGDKVPPEFQSNATKELDRRGVTRGTTESLEQAAQRRAREQDAVRIKAEDERKTIDQKRQDTALLDTFNSEKEIDLKRDRDLQVIEVQMEQLTTGLKSAIGRYNEAKGRADAVEKNNKQVGGGLKDDLARATADKERLEESIAAKQREKDELRGRYADYRKRYTELRNGSAQPGQLPVSAKK